MNFTWKQLGIDTHEKTTGQIKTFCPKCHAERQKHRHDQSLSVNLDMKTWLCHHCGYKGNLNFKTTNETEYIKPLTNFIELSEATKKWFSSRGISNETLTEFRVMESIEWMPTGEINGKEIPSGKRHTINLTYYRDNELVNIKYRDGLKNFRLYKGAELIFYNLDAIKGKTECLVCEGEIDCMSFHQAGYKTAISVPNGASKSNNSKLAYLDNCWEEFEDKEKIYVGVDCDEAGSFLRDELVRRFGADRCFIVTYEDCKDANEYLLKYGAEKLLERISYATPVPIQGIWKAESFKDKIYNLYNYGREKTLKLGLGQFDDLLTFRKGDLTVVTGIPSHGKSTFVIWLMTLLSAKHGWKWVMFAPENMPEEELFTMIANMFIGQQLDTDNPNFKMSADNLDLAYEFVNEHFYFFKFDEADITMDGICDIFKECVKKYGVQGGMIDPFNKIEHMMEKGQNETQYINKILSKLTTITKTLGMHVFFIAHPTKMAKDKDTGEYDVPTLYSISGSAHWYNQTDNGLIIYRNKDNTIDAIVQKVRWKFVGTAGQAKFNYHYFTGRYAEPNRDYLLPYRYWLEYKQNGVSVEYTEPIENNISEQIPQEDFPF